MCLQFVYIFDSAMDDLREQIPINAVVVAACQDRTLLCLRKPSEKAMVRTFILSESFAGSILKTKMLFMIFRMKLP